MTDESSPDPLDSQDPRESLDQDQDQDQDQDAVRRLLAEARLDEPMPADVVARLDDVLAGLSASGEVAEESQEPRDAAADPAGPTVASLSVHRRRRAAGLLVAAAAIVVGGVVAAQHLPSPSDGGSAGATAAEDRGAAQDSLTGGGSTSSGGTDSKSATPGAAPLSPSKATLRNGRVVVRPDRFTDDALAARRLLADSAQAFSASGTTARGCVAAPTGADVVKATYQGAPAALVFRRPVSNSQVVDLYLCGSSRAVRSATLPHP